MIKSPFSLEFSSWSCQPCSPPLRSQSQTKLVYRIADDATQEEKERGVRRTECTTERANADRPFVLLRLFGSWSGCLYLLFEDDGSDTACSQTYHTTTNEGEGREGRKRFGKVQQEENGGRPLYWTLLPLYLLCRRACNARNAILFVFLVIIVRAIN